MYPIRLPGRIICLFGVSIRTVERRLLEDYKVRISVIFRDNRCNLNNI